METNCKICGNELESPRDDYCYVPYVTTIGERVAYRSCEKCESKFDALTKLHGSERRALRERQAEELEMFHRGMEMTKEEKLVYCGNTAGMICTDHFYNEHNPYDVKECWSLKNAKLTDLEIYPSLDSNQRIGVRTLNCFRPERNRNAKWLRDAGLAKGRGEECAKES